jgi:hypothetical protein
MDTTTMIIICEMNFDVLKYDDFDIKCDYFSCLQLHSSIEISVSYIFSVVFPGLYLLFIEI